MMRVNYITNLNVNEFSGGWSGMNHNVHEQLKKHFDVHTVDKVNPPYPPRVVYASKAAKVLGLRRTFPAFTNGRLKKIANEVSSKSNSKAVLNFYHGVTPWLLTTNDVPYAMYLDCCFATYMRVYHRQNTFSRSQLKSLFKREAEFLNNAHSVFFSSKWGLVDTIGNYHLTGDNFYVAGLGGGLKTETSHRQKNTEEKYFLFAGLDFFGKGGDMVVQAFAEVQKIHPGIRLKIVGQKPPTHFLSIPNVEYAGRFSKSDHHQFEQLLNLFKNAYCFVLPTSKDITPLVLIEASSVGCPVIATDSFGIPEIVKHKETGLLLDTTKPLKDQVISAMNEMLHDSGLHQFLASNSKTHIENNFTWQRTGKIITDKIIEALP